MYRLIPRAELAILPGADHFLLFTRADELLALMTRFLDGPTPPGKQDAFGRGRTSSRAWGSRHDVRMEVHHGQASSNVSR
jgi:hypothetical protein